MIISSLLLLFISACAHAPSDVTLSSVTIVDRSNFPPFQSVPKEVRDLIGNTALMAEFTTKYNMNQNTSDGTIVKFCDQIYGNEILSYSSNYKITPIRENSFLYSKNIYKYLFFIDLSFYLKNKPDDDFKKLYDLRKDARDVCFYIIVYTMPFSGKSNIVRIPRSMIEAAFKNGVQPLPPQVKGKTPD
ncbi:Hypothetical protein GbCGDNIH6_8321 [Granulibacter bethesdensis]|nr:Hypothetical protein GbCGDNIH6_8321 [Granulibacter bethesdensis]